MSICIIFILMSLTDFAHAGEADPWALFFHANEAYEKGEYQKATEMYQRLICSGLINGHIYYNLGNAYFRINEIGEAIAAYLGAARFIPRDEDLRANISYAREQAVDNIEARPSTRVLRRLFFWYYAINLKETVFIFLCLGVVFWGTSIANIFAKREALTWVKGISLVLFILFGLTSALRFYNNSYTSRGVLVKEKIKVRAGNGREYSPIFELHEGADFVILDERENWYKIELRDGKKGWLLGDAVALVGRHKCN